MATFGKLQNEELSFHDGLNVVTLPNEAGKSTWCAFILAMLYGIDTSKRDSGGKLADKNRYRPWNAEGMSGTMEAEYKGKEIRIERGGEGGAMRGFRAVYTDTNDPVPELTAASCGETLTGLSRGVYERSGFIRQEGVDFDSIPELESRLQLLVSGSESAQMLPDARDRLSAWERKLKYNKTGLIPELEAGIAENGQEAAEAERLALQLAEARRRSADCEERLAQAEREAENHKKRDRMERGKRVAEARIELLHTEKELKKSGVPLADMGELYELSRQRENVSELWAKAGELERRDAPPETLPDDAPPAFSGLTPEEARKRAEEDETRAEELERKAAGGSKLWIVALLAALFVGFFLIGELTRVGIYAFAAAGAALVCGLVFFIRLRREQAAALEQLDALRSRYGGGDMLLLAEKYRWDCGQAQARGQESYKRELESARAAAEAAEKALLENASRLLGGSGTFEEVEPAVQAAIRKAKEHETLRLRYEVAKDRVKTLSEGLPDDSGKYELGPLPEVSTTPEEAERRLKAAREAREQALREESAVLGRLGALGDVDAVLQRREELMQQESEAKQALLAVRTAEEALEEAAAELRGRFSPRLNALAGEYLSALTGGKYTSLTVDRRFNASAREQSSSISRDSKALSAGTVDQIYLALRLALCRMLSENDPPPVILDDALCCFDDERAGYALDTLREISRDRQVILFTCQKREERLLESRQ